MLSYTGLQSEVKENTVFLLYKFRLLFTVFTLSMSSLP